MSTAAIGGASAQLASVMAAAALEGSQLGLVEAQVNATQAEQSSTDETAAANVDASAGAPGTLNVYA